MSTMTAPSLTINRTLDAAVGVVYAAWTDPAKIVKWFAPSDEMTCEVSEFDFKVGGGYTIVMHSPDGERHCVSGKYREIVENEKLVFSWAWESTPERVSQVTLVFRANGNTTRLQLMHEQFFDEAARDNHNIGWSACLERLATNIVEI